MYWPLIPAILGLAILGFSMLYVKRNRRGGDGTPFRGRSMMMALTVASLGLFIYALVGVLTTKSG